MGFDWKILLGVKLAQLYLEMTKLAWVGWVTGTLPFRQGPRWGFLLPCWQFRSHPVRTQGLPLPTFSTRMEVTKLSTGMWGLTILLSRDVSSCLLFITLIKFWQVSGFCCSKPYLSPVRQWESLFLSYWVTRPQLWNLRKTSTSSENSERPACHLSPVFVFYFQGGRMVWCGTFLFN